MRPLSTFSVLVTDLGVLEVALKGEKLDERTLISIRVYTN
jgi:hypothetical protein